MHRLFFCSGFICVLSLFRVCFPFRPLYSRVVIVYDINYFMTRIPRSVIPSSTLLL
jgi:hypothetical protein